MFLLTSLLILLTSLLNIEGSEFLVTCTRSDPAVLGGDVILTCHLQSNADVLQVTWKREKDNKTLASYSAEHGAHITEHFKGRVSFLSTNSTTSSIMLSGLEKEDEACYVCYFTVAKDGASPGRVCLPDLHAPEIRVVHRLCVLITSFIVICILCIGYRTMPKTASRPEDVAVNVAPTGFSAEETTDIDQTKQTKAASTTKNLSKRKGTQHKKSGRATIA